MAAKVTKPAYACVTKIAVELCREHIGVKLACQGQSRVEPGLHGQQQCQIGDIACHRPGHTELLEEHLVCRTVWHASKGCAQSVDIVEGSRCSQRTHHVCAVRDR